jgi:hypothetical protein
MYVQDSSDIHTIVGQFLKKNQRTVGGFQVFGKKKSESKNQKFWVRSSNRPVL